MNKMKTDKKRAEEILDKYWSKESTIKKAAIKSILEFHNERLREELNNIFKIPTNDMVIDIVSSNSTVKLSEREKILIRATANLMRKRVDEYFKSKQP